MFTAATDIRFLVNGVTFTTTFLSREDAVWEYSYTENRALDGKPSIDKIINSSVEITASLFRSYTETDV